MTTRRLWMMATLALLWAGSTAAQTPSPTLVPRQVHALEGCWRGTGEAVGKHVVVALTSRTILDQAMFTVDVESNTIGNKTDRYAAHLIFGGLDRSHGVSGDDIVSFWSDTFGGAYAVSGRGRSIPGGFDVTYDYPDSSFVNHWRLEQDRLTWIIVQHAASGSEKPFAEYALAKVSCS